MKFHTCLKCGRKTDDLACCWYDDETDQNQDITMYEVLEQDNKRMRQAGSDLAIAAMRVIRDYDGTHRLALAVAAWNTVIANEGHREGGTEQEENRQQHEGVMNLRVPKEELTDTMSALTEENKQLEEINEIYLDALEDIILYSAGSIRHSYQWDRAVYAIQAARDKSRETECGDEGKGLDK